MIQIDIIREAFYVQYTDAKHWDKYNMFLFKWSPTLYVFVQCSVRDGSNTYNDRVSLLVLAGLFIFLTVHMSASIFLKEVFLKVYKKDG